MKLMFNDGNLNPYIKITLWQTTVKNAESIIANLHFYIIARNIIIRGIKQVK